MIEKIFALLVVIACVLLLVRQFIGARRRDALDAALLRMTSRLRRGWRSLQAHWNAKGAERSSRQASRMADDAIRKARDGAARKTDVSREGNVYTPKAFGEKRHGKGENKGANKRDTLH